MGNCLKTIEKIMKDDKTFTLEELKAFINLQPDDRPIDMDQIYGDCGCGCVLVHFGRKFFHRKIVTVGFAHIFNDRGQYLCGLAGVWGLIGLLLRKRPTTYGQAKQILKNYV